MALCRPCVYLWSALQPPICFHKAIYGKTLTNTSCSDGTRRIRTLSFKIISVKGSPFLSLAYSQSYLQKWWFRVGIPRTTKALHKIYVRFPVGKKWVRIQNGEHNGPRSFSIGYLSPGPTSQHPTYNEQISDLRGISPIILHTETVHPRDPR